ncbi:MAG: RsiV family protein, partial [Actinomycetota bacterium]
TFEQVLLDDRQASLRVYRSFYAAGAAHPGTGLVTYTVDLLTGEFHELGDLFKPGVDHLGFLSGISRRLLEIEGVGTEETRTEGTAPEPENFDGWVLARDGIEVTFGEYQVASYAEGMPRILVLRQAMGDLLALEGPLGYPAG